jgi:uncharacterized protein
MKFILDDISSGHAIEHYATNVITVNGKTYDRSLVLMPDRVIPEWRPDSFKDLQIEDFALLGDLTPEIVILGTGAKQYFPAHALIQPLIDKQIGLEVMDTAAACRTYNILMSEGRHVSAALFMIEA